MAAEIADVTNLFTISDSKICVCGGGGGGGGGGTDSFYIGLLVWQCVYAQPITII